MICWSRHPAQNVNQMREDFEIASGARQYDNVLDLFCGSGLFGISLAKHMMDTSKPLRNLNGYEAYNQAIANARTNATRIGLDKSRFTFKSADLSQPTLGARINCDIVIVGKPPVSGKQDIVWMLVSHIARTQVCRITGGCIENACVPELYTC